MHPGVGEDVAYMLRVRLAAQGFAGLDEVVQSALAFAQICAFAVVDAMGNPIYDQCFGAGIPQWAIDRIPTRIDDVKAVFGRGRLGVDTDGGCGLVVLLAAGGKLQDVVPRRREGRGGDGRGGGGKCDGSGSGLLGPAHDVAAVRLKPRRLAGEVRFATHHYRAVEPGVDDWRQRGDGSRAIDAPLQDGGRVRAVGRDLDAHPVCADLVEGGAVESVERRAETLRIRYRDEVAAVPVEDAICLRQSNRAARGLWVSGEAFDTPVDVDPAGGDRTRPVVLRPLRRLESRTQDEHAVVAVERVGGNEAVVQRRDLVLACAVKTGGHGDAREIG